MTSEREAMMLERQAFEHAFASGDVDYDAHIFRQFHDGSYYDEHAQDKWEGWQAAFKHLSRAAEPVAFRFLAQSCTNTEKWVWSGWMDLSDQGTAAMYTMAKTQGCKIEYAYTRPPEPARDAKDAARYRWLRERHWNNAAMCVVADPKRSVKLGFDCPSGERLDAAIDAAMAQESGE